MTPATYDFDVVRGSSGPTQGLVFRLKAKEADGSLSNIPFEDIRLSIYRHNVLIVRFALSDGGLVISDPVENEISWIPTAEETRLIPVGAKATYELESWNGTSEIVYMIGTITGIGGSNDDSGAAS